MVLLKQVVLYEKKLSFTGKSSLQREGKIQRDILKSCHSPGSTLPSSARLGRTGHGRGGLCLACLPAAALSNRLLPNLAGRVRLQVIKFLFCSLPKSLWEARIQCVCLLPALLFPFPFPLSLLAGEIRKKGEVACYS